MIHLTRIDGAQNMARYYVIDVQPNLFGEWSLVTEWGRIGRGGTIKTESFPGREPAVAALEKRRRQKQRRGYA